MRKPPVFAVEKQKLRQCLCLWRKHKSDGKKQENVLKNKNIYSGSVRATEAEICGGLIRRERF